LDLEVPAGNLTIDATGTLTARFCVMKNVVATGTTGIGVDCTDESGTLLEGVGTNGNTNWIFSLSGAASSRLPELGMQMGRAPG
jgi:hypothetical protein